MALYGMSAAVALVVLPWIGPVAISPRGVCQEWRAADGRAPQSDILLAQRVPRVLLGMCIGAALGMAGATFQVTLRNALATPYTLGIASAGALAAAITLALAPTRASGAFVVTPYLAALAGSGVAAAGMFVLARRMQHKATHVLLLTGVAVNMFCGSALLVVRYLVDPYHLVTVDRWLMGGLMTVGYADVAHVVPFLIVGAVVIMRHAHSLNQLAFGAELARARGVHVERVLLQAFGGSVLMTAGAVAVSGPIGFVGLLVPHAVRIVSGVDQRMVLPASALLGAVLLASCDALARTCVAPTEIPVGVITACLGAPLFVIVLLRRSAAASL
jgi:iron complex transport system permease protein